MSFPEAVAAPNPLRLILEKAVVNDDTHRLSGCQSVQRRSQASRFKQWASANAEKVERFREASDSVGRVPAQGYGLQRQLRRHGVQACACQGTTPLQSAGSRLLVTRRRHWRHTLARASFRKRRVKQRA